MYQREAARAMVWVEWGRRCSLLSAVLFAAAILAGLGAAQPAAAAASRCFSETGQCISGRFLQYWEQNGGLPVFGYPITPAYEEQTAEGRFIVQYFERERFEYQPQNAAPYDVLLGRLGDQVLSNNSRDWRIFGRGAPQDGCLYFEQTGQSLCEPFLSYWQSHGLEFDRRPGASYAESLALFGLPLSAPQPEVNLSGHDVLTQWFERARFEYHPANPPQHRVLLGLLGSELRAPQPVGLDPMAQRVVELTNAERVQRGLRPLTVDTRLVSAAAAHSQDMVNHNMMSHTGSDGSNPGDRLERAGYDWLTYGENVAAGQTTPEAVVAAWMASEGHRANILNPAFKEIGVAAVYREGTRYGWYWTQAFGAR